MLNPVFDQFVKKSPISVMARGMMERVLDPQQLDNWFENDRRPTIHQRAFVLNGV